MSISILNAGASGGAAEQFGVMNALQQGGFISWTVAGILTIMLFFSLYIMFTKLFEQQKIMNQARRVKASFWNSNSLREGAAKLEKNTAYKQLVDDGLAAQEQHSRLTDPVEAHDWLHGSLRRSEDVDQLAAGRRSRLPRDGRRDRAVHRSVRYGARHLPRADQHRSGRSGVDRQGRRPGRRGADHDRVRSGRRGSRGARLQLAAAPQQVDRRGPQRLLERRAGLSGVERCGEADGRGRAKARLRPTTGAVRRRPLPARPAACPSSRVRDRREELSSRPDHPAGAAG